MCDMHLNTDYGESAHLKIRLPSGSSTILRRISRRAWLAVVSPKMAMNSEIVEKGICQTVEESFVSHAYHHEWD